MAKSNIIQTVDEETDSWHSVTMTDNSTSTAAYLTSSNVASLTMTIYLTEDESTVIVDARDLRNGGAWDQGATITDATGVLRTRITATDNTRNTTAGYTNEDRTILFEGTTAGSPTYAFKHALRYRVKAVPNKT